MNDITQTDANMAVAVALQKEIKALKQENERLQEWVNDLQSGMYVNCVYCGHRYGPNNETPAIMSEVLYEHIRQCKNTHYQKPSGSWMKRKD